MANKVKNRTPLEQEVHLNKQLITLARIIVRSVPASREEEVMESLAAQIEHERSNSN